MRANRYLKKMKIDRLPRKTVSVLVSVGSAIRCARLPGAAGVVSQKSRINTVDFRCVAFTCATMPKGLVGIMSPLLTVSLAVRGTML